MKYKQCEDNLFDMPEEMSSDDHDSMYKDLPNKKAENTKSKQ